MSQTTEEFHRTSMRYRFADQDMDTFFVAAMGWSKAGGLDVGELFALAREIEDGDPESWTRQFRANAELQRTLSAGRLARGRRRTAAELLLKAAASARSAWQFCAPGELLTQLMRQAQRWHAALDVPRKDLIVFDAASGADAHCQINNPTRMMQEVCDWVAEVLGGPTPG